MPARYAVIALMVLAGFVAVASMIHEGSRTLIDA
jgi:hypothetical protein